MSQGIFTKSIDYQYSQIMIKLIKHTPLTWGKTFNYKFASAAAAIDYYSLLGVQKGSTTKQIEEAFAKLTRNVNPDNNSAFFNKITQAFVILSDGKARDAYDSLLKVRKFSFINNTQTKPMTTSYLADRKADKHREFSKQYNLDKFGRYRGGVPRPNSTQRGRSLGETGILFASEDKTDVDKFPEYTVVDTETAESFKNFHQDERKHRTAKKTWYTATVDYEFFSLRRLMNRLTWPKYLIMIIFVLPTIVNGMIGIRKRLAKNLANHEKELKEKRKAAKAAH